MTLFWKQGRKAGDEFLHQNFFKSPFLYFFMKIMYIESKLKNLKSELIEQEIKKLPKNLVLAYSIQYKELAEQIKKQLEKNKIKIKIQQVLGCSRINNSSNLPILFIGSGRFHALNLYLQSSNIYVLENNKIIKVPEQEINSLIIKRKSSLLKFLNADNLGILVSAKPGQENLNQALELRQKLIKKGKKAWIFISNNIDINQFENFNINSWINTACPGLSYDNPHIINSSELPEM